MSKNCSIVEDLLPLYTEGLLQDETVLWMEAHLKSCHQCADLAHLSTEQLTEESIPSTINHKKMMTKITMKLSLYQIIFVGLSFFLAIKTTLLNESLGFILSYTILGLITYLFYKNVKLIVAITFLPVFIWSIVTTIPNIHSVAESLSVTIVMETLNNIVGSLFLATIHLIFALVGAAIGFSILKLKESR